MNARKLQSKLSMKIEYTGRASKMVLYCMGDHNILRTESHKNNIEALTRKSGIASLRKLTFTLKRYSSISFLRFSIKLRLIGETSPASIMMRSFEDPNTKQLVPLSAAASFSVNLKPTYSGSLQVHERCSGPIANNRDARKVLFLQPGFLGHTIKKNLIFGIDS